MSIKHTSYSNNKWGLVQSEPRVKYEYKHTHNLFSLMVFLVPAVIVVSLIVGKF